MEFVSVYMEYLCMYEKYLCVYMGWVELICVFSLAGDFQYCPPFSPVLSGTSCILLEIPGILLKMELDMLLCLFNCFWVSSLFVHSAPVELFRRHVQRACMLLRLLHVFYSCAGLLLGVLLGIACRAHWVFYMLECIRVGAQSDGSPSEVFLSFIFILMASLMEMSCPRESVSVTSIVLGLSGVFLLILPRCRWCI